MIEDIIKQSYVQLGSIALLLAYMFWTIKTTKEECAKERDLHDVQLKASWARNDDLTDRVFSMAQSMEKTMAELRAAIEARNP